MCKCIKNNLGKIIGYSVCIVLILTVMLLRLFVGTVINVSGESMVPTFNDGDFILTSAVYDSTELNVGDIVILKENGKYLVKRIYGTPNTTTDIDIIKHIPAVQLGDNEYYVVGDNYQVSRDSRSFGPIQRDDIKFKYAGVSWTGTSFFITAALPVILLIAAITIVAVPADKRKTITEEAPMDNNTKMVLNESAPEAQETTEQPECEYTDCDALTTPTN